MRDEFRVRFQLRQLVGDSPLLLLDIKPTYEYVNEEVTDKIIGATYVVLEQGGDFGKYTIKVPDWKRALEPDLLKNKKSAIFVDFTNTVCKFYLDKRTKQLRVSITADDIVILD